MTDQSHQIDLAGNQLVVESLTVSATSPGSIATSVTGISAASLTTTKIVATSVTTTTGLVTGALTVNGAIQSSSTILANGATSAIGYTTGAGSSIDQASSGTTAVTLSVPTGQVTLFATSCATLGGFSFVLTNTVAAATDIWITNITNSLGLNVSAIPALTAATIIVRNGTAASVLATGKLQFAIMKAVVA